jgi:hypothetical protein
MASRGGLGGMLSHGGYLSEIEHMSRRRAEEAYRDAQMNAMALMGSPGRMVSAEDIINMKVGTAIQAEPVKSKKLLLLL